MTEMELLKKEISTCRSKYLNKNKKTNVISKGIIVGSLIMIILATTLVWISLTTSSPVPGIVITVVGYYYAYAVGKYSSKLKADLKMEDYMEHDFHRIIRGINHEIEKEKRA